MTVVAAVTAGARKTDRGERRRKEKGPEKGQGRSLKSRQRKRARKLRRIQPKATAGITLVQRQNLVERKREGISQEEDLLQSFVVLHFKLYLVIGNRIIFLFYSLAWEIEDIFAHLLLKNSQQFVVRYFSSEE